MKAFYNGKIYSNHKFYDAMVIEGKIIKYIGDRDNAFALLDNDNTQKINLEGKMVLPGFVDSHAHGGYSTVMGINQVDLTKGKCAEDYQKIVEKFAMEHPEIDFIQGMGWSAPCFEEAGPKKELLDEVVSDRPVALRASEGHAIWANSMAIEAAGVNDTTESPEGGVIEKNPDNSVRGTFKEEARKLIEAVMPEPAIEDFKKAILAYQQFMASYGYTACVEAMVEKNSNLHKAYIELAEEDKLLMKAELLWLVNPCDAEEIDKKLGKSIPVFKNKLADGFYAKIFIDGVIENGTGWLKEPYVNNPDNFGEWLWDDSLLFDTCASLDALGYDLHFHVIGDAAVKQMNDAVEEMIKRNGNRKRRTVAAHVQLADSTEIRRMSELGISVAASPFWFVKDEQYYDGVEYPLLGERADLQYPMKSLMDAGIVVSSASDYSVTAEPDPLLSIRLGMMRSYPFNGVESEVLFADERVDRNRMVDTVTKNGIYTMNLDKYTGVLEQGKLADFVVVDSDIFEIDMEVIHQAKVLMTISEGEVIYKADCKE